MTHLAESEYTSIVQRLVNAYGDDKMAMVRKLGDVAQITKEEALAIIEKELPNIRQKDASGVSLRLKLYRFVHS